MRTLVDLVPRIAARPHDAALVSTSTDTMTVGEFLDRIERLAGVLQQAHVGPGSRIGVHHANGPDAIVAWFATWTAGATVVPLNPRVATDELARIATTAQVERVLATPDGAAHVPPGLPVMRHTGDEIEAARGPDVAAPPTTDGRGGEVALVQFTSGTTGTPKPVPLRHDTIAAMLNSVLGELSGRGDTPRAEPMPNLIPVSLSLWAGIYNVLFAFTAGAPVVVMTTFEPATFAELVRRYEIRSVVLPPAAMVMLSDADQITSLEPLRYVRSITAPLSPSEAVRFHDRFGVAILNCYGQTELGGEVIGWTAADWKQHGVDKLGAVGRPHRGVDVRLVDGHEVVAGADAVGELQVRTASTKKDVAHLAEDRHGGEGFVRTGDLARIDDDGFIWIVGRRSSMINRGGLKVAPGDVEEAIRTVPGVVDAAVIGAPDRRLGEVPWAFVVWREGETPDLAAVESRCREKLAGYKVPAGWTVIDALPRNEIGKIVPRDLLAHLPEADMPDGAPSTRRDEADR